MKKNRMKIVVMALIAGCIANVQASNVDIGSFATGSFTLDTSSLYLPTQSASGLTTSTTVAAGDTFYGNFTSPSDWTNYGFTGASNPNLGLLMSVTGTNSNLGFSLYLLDSTGGLIEAYTGTTTGVGTALQFVALTPDASIDGQGVGFATSVSTVVVGWNSPGAINTTFAGIQSTVNLAAIPEPSVASLLALGTVGLVALRVRRKS